MSRLRVDSSFANFVRPLSVTRLPTSEPSLKEASDSTEALRSLLASLKPPFSQSVDDALDYLSTARTAALADNAQDETLKAAVVNQVAVGLYARSLDEYLNEATQIEAEAEWWSNVERSRVNVAWFLIQTLPQRLLRAFRTILHTIREQHLPLQLSVFSPSSLFRLFPSTAFQPSALTRAFFPHLEDQQMLVSVVWTRPSSRTPRFIHSIWSAIFLPFYLTREECRFKRRQLESLRDARAEQLGRLAELRTVASTSPTFPSQRLTSILGGIPTEPPDNLEHVQLISSVLLPRHIEAHGAELGRLCRPSRLSLIWPKLLLYPPLVLFTINSLYNSRVSLAQMALETKETMEGFIKNSLVDPLKEVLKTVRTGGENGVIVRREGVVADLDARIFHFASQIRVGDLTPVLQLYEEDIKRPVKSALTGTLLRSMFIQVQKAKVDIDQALSGIDKLLKSQELTFAFVGLAPALVIVAVASNSLSRMWRGALSQGRFGRSKNRSMAWGAMRRIERLLVSQPRVTGPTSLTLSDHATGMLLISLARLRKYAETSLPANSRLREGFLEDVGDLEDPAMPREEKLRVVGRMWTCWGGVLGWGSAAL
ncbi:NCA2-domain-containing protein [Mycena amicta]|nr:NCA2-domain-containing protein [Mycena amicta]